MTAIVSPTNKSSGEFALIRDHFATLTANPDFMTLGVGDDCALLKPTAGIELALTTDTLVAGRHFPVGTTPQDIGWKSLAVSLSDLAAMGAQPLAFLLALTLPEVDRPWLAAFSQGLQAMTRAAGIALVGGDTTRGPLSITITAIGSVPVGTALKRSGAKPDDVICVTGTLGDAALALERWSSGEAIEAGLDDRLLLERLNCPTPRLPAGLALRSLAHAAIDLSDGLAGDLGHVLDASGVGAEIFVEDLPMSVAFARLHPAAERLRLQAAGGDDYELCVCMPAENIPIAQTALDGLLKPIGRVTCERGLRWLDKTGRAIDVQLNGHDHFG